MPYCTVQEAWFGESLCGNDQKNQSKRFKKIVPENASSKTLGYSNVDYPESNIYDKNTKKLFDYGTQNKNIQRRTSFSRTYNRLPGHSGPKTRLPKSTDNMPIESERIGGRGHRNNQRYHQRKNRGNGVEMEELVNDYDLQLEEEVMDEGNGDYEEEFTVKKNKYVNKLLVENRKLRDIIENFSSGKNDNDNIFDLVVFLSTGIFIIFFLDMLSKVVRRF